MCYKSFEHNLKEISVVKAHYNNRTLFKSKDSKIDSKIDSKLLNFKR
jgi:hypothetical protein